jgi:hypothetical protein
MTSIYKVQNIQALKKPGILSLRERAGGLIYRCTKRSSRSGHPSNYEEIAQPTPVVVTAGQTSDHLLGRHPRNLPGRCAFT